MKRIAITTLFIVFCSSVLAQNIQSNFVTESAAGKFEETKGAILKKEKFEGKSFQGFTSTISITPAMITNLRNGEKEAYVIVGSTIDKASYSSFIDYDELPACIEALDYIINSEVNNKPDNYVDVFIKTRDALEIGAVYGLTLTGTKWQTAIAHRKYVSNATATVSVKNLQEIMEALKAAKVLLEEKLN